MEGADDGEITPIQNALVLQFAINWSTIAALAELLFWWMLCRTNACGAPVVYLYKCRVSQETPCALRRSLPVWSSQWSPRVFPPSRGSMPSMVYSCVCDVRPLVPPGTGMAPWSGGGRLTLSWMTTPATIYVNCPAAPGSETGCLQYLHHWLITQCSGGDC